MNHKEDYKGVPTDVTKWPMHSHRFDYPEFIPESPGIYVIRAFNAESVFLGYTPIVRCLYIGQSSNLRKRYVSHEVLREWSSEFNCIVFNFIEIPNADKHHLLDVEKFFIKMLDPITNKQHKNG